jgi:hypothetical protein
VTMATDWVVYSEGEDGTCIEPRGTLHFLDADKNAFPCGTQSARHAWSLDEAIAVLDAPGPPMAAMCPVCDRARNADM